MITAAPSTAPATIQPALTHADRPPLARPRGAAPMRGSQKVGGQREPPRAPARRARRPSGGRLRVPGGRGGSYELGAILVAAGLGPPIEHALISLLALNGLRVSEAAGRYGAGRIVRKAARHAGIGKTVTPHTLRHAFITAALDAGVPLRDVQEAASHADPRTTIRYDRARGSLDRHATYIVAAYVAGAAR